MNRERWLLLISILIFAGLGVYYLRPGWIGDIAKKKSTGTTARSQPVPEGISSRGLAEVAEAKVKSEKVDETTSWGRNPFLTELEAARGRALGTGLDGLRIRAIIMGRPTPVAVIDGKTVAVGEKIGEETVVAIREDSVVLEVDGVKRILRLK